MTTPSYYRTDLSPQALKAWQAAHPELAPDRDTPMPPITVNHDYDPKPLTPAEQFRADMMSLLDQMRGEIEQMHAEITQIRDGLTHAATPPTPAGNTETIPATRLERERVKGKTYYRIMGGRYTRHGIRIWPEGLAAIGINPDTIPWADDDSYTITPPLMVAALVEPHNDKDGNEITGPTKIIGLA